METTTILIVLYFMFNNYIAGTLYDEWGMSTTINHKIIFIGTTLLLFGSLIFILISLWNILLTFVKWQQEITFSGFWWRYYCTKEYNDLPIERLEYLNKEKRGTDFQQKRFKFCVSLINKRNNYTPKIEENEQ